MDVNSIPQRVAERFVSAKRVAVLTGAGVSAESGIDTFRGEDGTWSKVNIEEVATPQGFARDPEKVWRWYDSRRVGLTRVKPNPAHLALAAMERHFDHFALITQNVDGLHRAAGSENVIELHGNIWEVIDTLTGEREFNYEAPLQQIPISSAPEWFGSGRCSLRAQWRLRPGKRKNAMFSSSSAHRPSFSRRPRCRSTPNERVRWYSNSR